MAEAPSNMQFIEFESNYGEPGVQYVAPPIRGTGRLGFPKTVFATNLFELKYYKDNPEKVPQGAEQWRDRYDFYVVLLNMLAQSGEGIRGAIEFEINVNLQVPEAKTPDDLQFDSVAPDNEYKDKSVTGEFEVSIDTEGVSNLLKLVPGVGSTLAGVVPGIDGSLKWKWNPKVATITSGGVGHDAFWRFRREPSKYLDGEHELLAIMRRPKEYTGPIVIKIDEARAEFDKPWDANDVQRTAFIHIAVKYLEEEVVTPS